MTAALPTEIEGAALAIATRGVAKRYGRDFALLGVDLQVPEGAVYVLVGPNGAGKTTTLKLLLGLLKPDTGSVRVLGMDPRANGPVVRAQVGYVPERGDWGYAYMTVGRLLQHHAVYFPAWDWQYAAKLANAFELDLSRTLGKLSKGLARRVHLLLAMAHRPPLLVLDEPTDGLDPVMRDETLGMLAEHVADTGCTVLICTHIVHEVDRLADHLGVMRDGRLTAQMPRETLHRMLRRYRADVPEGWAGVPGLDGTVIRRGGVGREIQWSVWGDEREVSRRLTESGATLRDAAPLTLPSAPPVRSCTHPTKAVKSAAKLPTTIPSRRRASPTLAAVAAFFCWMGILSGATGGGVEPVDAWRWAAPFAGATVLYLLASALTLATSRPWRWLGGAAVGYFFLGAFRAVDAARPLTDAVDAVVSGHYGLTTVITGLVADPNFKPRFAMTPDAGAWLTATFLWLAASLSLFLWAAYRQPER